MSRLDLQANEHIFAEARRHWISILPEVIILILFVLLPLVVVYFLAKTKPFGSPKIELLYWFTAGAWWLLVWIRFFIVWTNYYLDVWIITNVRIIDINQIGLFSREVSELRLDRIQDYTVEVKGIIATALKYGDLYVQTAAEEERFVIHSVSRPEQVRDLISRLHDEAVAENQPSPTPLS